MTDAEALELQLRIRDLEQQVADLTSQLEDARREEEKAYDHAAEVRVDLDVAKARAQAAEQDKATALAALREAYQSLHLNHVGQPMFGKYSERAPARFEDCARCSTARQVIRDLEGNND